MTEERCGSAEGILGKERSPLQLPLEAKNENANSTTPRSYEILVTGKLPKAKTRDGYLDDWLTSNLGSGICDTRVIDLQNGPPPESLNSNSIETDIATGPQSDFPLIADQAGSKSNVKPPKADDYLSDGFHIDQDRPTSVELIPRVSEAPQTRPLIPTTKDSDFLLLPFANEDNDHPICIHCPANPVSENYTEWIGSCTCTCDRCMPIPTCWSFGGMDDPFESVFPISHTAVLDDDIYMVLERSDEDAPRSTKDLNVTTFEYRREQILSHFSTKFSKNMSGDYSLGCGGYSEDGWSPRSATGVSIDSLASAFGNLAIDAPFLSDFCWDY